MGSEPRTTPGDAVGPSADYVTFTSAAYTPTTDDEAARATAEWLETQSLHPFIREVGEKSLARLDLQKGESVLEIGCGTGVFLPRLAALTGPDGHVVGLDYAPAFLTDARERLAEAGLTDRVELVEGDAHHLPFDNAAFDAAHCERVLMHVEDPAGVIREMRRVVRPGGRAVAAEIFGAAATMDTSDPVTNRQIELAMISGIRNSQMGIQLRGLFVEAGFADVDGEIVGYFEEELDEDEAEEYGRVAQALVANGSLDSARAKAAIEGLADRRARGTHCGLSVMFVVSGRVPEGDRDGA